MAMCRRIDTLISKKKNKNNFIVRKCENMPKFNRISCNM